MRFTTLTLLIALLYLQSWAATPIQRIATDPIASSMGNLVHSSPHFLNPAFAVTDSSCSLYVNYHNEYEVKELGSWEGSFHLHSHWAEHIVRLNYFGFKNYNRISLNYGIGKQLSEKWSIGTNIRLQRLDFAECPETPINLYGDIGAQFIASPKIGIGVLCQNIASAQLTAEERDETEEDFSCLTYASVRFLDNARWLLEIEKWKDDGWEARNGFEFCYERIALRCGFRMLPIVTALGCGFDLKWMLLDLSTYYHNQLGYSLSIGIGHKF